MPSLPVKSSPLSDLIERDCTQIIKQGAEAKVYLSRLAGQDVILKHRFAKAYRHPTLDKQLTKTRLASEARALVKAARSGVQVPGVLCLDLEAGILGVQVIQGKSVREVLGVKAEGALDQNSIDLSASACPIAIDHETMFVKIGQEIAKMHHANLIHGDLTTSNMMIKGEECYLIDFGLAFNSADVEDKAVDLYVLERAFLSTHPSSAASLHRSELFERVLKSYADQMGAKHWKLIKNRLEDVRMRGRKRSMVG